MAERYWFSLQSMVQMLNGSKKEELWRHIRSQKEDQEAVAQGRGTVTIIVDEITEGEAAVEAGIGMSVTDIIVEAEVRA